MIYTKLVPSDKKTDEIEFLKRIGIEVNLSEITEDRKTSTIDFEMVLTKNSYQELEHVLSTN